MLLLARHSPITRWSLAVSRRDETLEVIGAFVVVCALLTGLSHRPRKDTHGRQVFVKCGMANTSLVNVRLTFEPIDVSHQDSTSSAGRGARPFSKSNQNDLLRGAHILIQVISRGAGEKSRRVMREASCCRVIARIGTTSFPATFFLPCASQPI
jgi:hypothetical protein